MAGRSWIRLPSLPLFCFTICVDDQLTSLWHIFDTSMEMHSLLLSLNPLSWYGDASFGVKERKHAHFRFVEEQVL